MMWKYTGGALGEWNKSFLVSCFCLKKFTEYANANSKLSKGTKPGMVRKIAAKDNYTDLIFFVSFCIRT